MQEYMRKWREENKEKLRAQRRERYLKEKPNRPTRRKDILAKCALCEIRLSSPFGTKTRRKYCDGCATNAKLSKALWSLYQRRKYQKSTGVKVEQINAYAIMSVTKSL